MNLPTDATYKLMSLEGIALVVTSAGFLYSAWAERQALQEAAELSYLPFEQARSAIEEKTAKHNTVQILSTGVG